MGWHEAQVRHSGREIIVIYMCIDYTSECKPISAMLSYPEENAVKPLFLCLICRLDTALAHRIFQPQW